MENARLLLRLLHVIEVLQAKSDPVLLGFGRILLPCCIYYCT